MQDTFKNRVAFVTGGASGIGQAACLGFCGEGASVVIVDRDEEKNIRLQKKIEESGREALFVKTDVTSSQSLKNAVDETVKKFGRIHFAFNNAGIESRFNGLTADYPEEEWMRIIQVNLTGVWLSMKYELEVMLKQKSGVIVNNASVLGLVGFRTASPYSASKHGVIGLTQTAAVEYAAKGIRINAVCPGFIETPMIDRLGISSSDAALKSIVDLHPAKRLGKPEEIANAVIYLCKDESAFINGSALVIDGGYLAK